MKYFILLLLIGLSFAQNLTINYVHLGYGSVQDTLNPNGDDMIVGTMIGLAVAALLFAYLHINSKTQLWSQLWFLFSILMVMVESMALQSFANEQGNTALAGVGLALFGLFFAVFVIMTIRLIWTLYQEYIGEVMAVLDGRKKND